MRHYRLIMCFFAAFVFLFYPVLFSFLHAEEPGPALFNGLYIRNIGPAVMSGRIVDLAVVEEDPVVFYAASATGGLWKTENNGVTFEPVFQDQPVHSIGDAAVHQKNPQVVWVGTGERANRQSSSWGNGVYKSSDSGETWMHMGLEKTRHIGRIALHPEDPDIVYVAAMGHLWGSNPERGLYRSRDGGEKWKKILYVDEDTGVADVAVDPENPDILYAAAYQRRRRPYGFHGGGPGSGLFKSTDGGDTWAELTNGLPEGDKGRIGISIYRRNPEIVYVCVEQGWRYNASTAYNERRAGIYRSGNKGNTWTHMSDWNPRPMYASQILVDPNDDQRIYMQNSFSYSDDGGKTFNRARQSLHGDDRILWVDPRDSRHLIKGDDGGVGISYDRAETWLYVTSLPVSQFYRISVDMRKPYWIYGGLQDNGSWAGPSEVYRRSGILNEDWIKTGGGDGFVNLVDPEDPDTLYMESQYLGLSRFDLTTRESRDIRPGDPKGHISARRNWDAWGPGLPEPDLGNAMAPANWDGPFIISPHHPKTLYAGTDQLWKSTDGGYSWSSLGNLTTGIDRRELKIMDQRPEETTPSLDDGIPYYPTITVIAESPLQEGILYAGTDDGCFHVSRDGGGTWRSAAADMPGLPQNAWFSGIEPSRFAKGTVYVIVNNYRNDDYANYAYKSTDYGRTWTSICGDLPEERVLRTLREDTRNPDLLFLGAELGLFFTLDGGTHWIPLKNNMPTAAFNDLVIHPRDNDLVLGTHGRGIWILDNIACLQELTPEVLASPAHLFSVETAEMIRLASEKGHAGDMIFRGENPPQGAVIDYYLNSGLMEDDIRLTILDDTSRTVAELNPKRSRGINRVAWDLRYDSISGPALGDGERSRSLRGPLVVPGLYTVKLEAGGAAGTQTFRVKEDPRIEISFDERKEWTQTLLDIAELYRQSSHELEVWSEQEKGESSEMDERGRTLRELNSRIASLYYQVSSWTGRMTQDQQAQLEYFINKLAELKQR